MTKDEALKLALEFVASISPAFICEATHHIKKEQHEISKPCPHVEKQKRVYAAIKEALAQPEQEPVAIALNTGTKQGVKWLKNVEHGESLYTTPPQRQPMTDEEIQEVATKAVRERRLSWLGFKQDNQGTYNIPVLSPADYQFARAIEAKLKEKNT